MRYVLPLLFGVLLLAGCATHRASSQALVSRTSQGRYELQLLSVEWCAGGPCNFPQWPHREYLNYWIYTDTTNGVVSADRVTVAYGRAGDSFRPTQEGPLHGSVSFSNGRVLVALQTPAFPDGEHLKYYQEFRLNGTYTLRPQ
jgi:hypothetical protein